MQVNILLIMTVFHNFTDLKKTLAFLLESMMGRLDRMERIMSNLQQAVKDEDPQGAGHA